MLGKKWNQIPFYSIQKENNHLCPIFLFFNLCKHKKNIAFHGLINRNIGQKYINMNQPQTNTDWLLNRESTFFY